MPKLLIQSSFKRRLLIDERVVKGTTIFIE